MIETSSDGIPELIEVAARAVATANGYHYSGDSIIENAKDNPRSAHFVEVAAAVIKVVREHDEILDGTGAGADMISDFPKNDT